MKKQKESILLALYFIVALFGLVFVLRYMTNIGYDGLGTSATNLAKILSGSIEISNDDVDTLLKLDFDELLENPTNKGFEEILKRANLSENVKYTYLIRKLDEEEIKYTVDDEEVATFFGYEIGTELDYIWLLDYIVNNNERERAYNKENYYNDIYRYTNANESIEEYYNSQSSGYIFHKGGWGQTITGLAPIYSIEGDYVGLVGVDIYASEYYQYRRRVVTIISVMFLLLTAILVSIFAIRYLSIKNEMQRDKLTGLYLRTYYEKFAFNSLKNIGKSNKTLTFVMVDIDEFKLYNDFYGHIKGDSVLSTISKVLLNEVLEFEGCAGRFGGEEFIVFVPNITIEQGDKLCESVRKKVMELNIEHENGVSNKFVTVSIGSFTATSAHNNLKLEEIIELTDKALYTAKESGRNKYIRQSNDLKDL